MKALDSAPRGERFVRVTPRAMEHASHTRDHFTRTERFPNVIVGAEVETADAIGFARPRR